ncbi:MAG: sulfatase [Bacteroidales bacterium]|nr:sulfatase [Bacteroidales bacterium]
MRQNPLALSGALLLASMPGTFLTEEASAQGKDEAKRLNIIHIMTDDHAFQAISAYGHPLSRQAPTPNMDRLAAEGIRFDRAYVENSLSTPSRACLMTGLYSHQNGQRTLGTGIDTTVTFVPELLRQGGYQTAMIGKWHMQCEPKGFDYYYIFRDQGEYYNPVVKSHLSSGEYIREEGYATSLVTSHAIGFLEERDPDKPFCLYVHHKAPHRNWMPDIKYLDLYEDVTFPLPDNFHDNYTGKGEAERVQRMSIDQDMSMIYDLKVGELDDEPSRSKHTKDMLEWGLSRMDPETRAAWEAAYGPKNRAFLEKGLEGEALLEWKFQRYVKDYLRCIRSVDDSVGEILEYLDTHGLADNTIVVYTSDQGFYMGEHGWFDKRFMYEESYRTPLIIRYPGGQGGKVSDAFVQNLDFAPTYLDVAGVEAPEEMSGLSLLPVIKKGGKEPARWRKYMYYHYYDIPSEHNVLKHDGGSDKRYKLIHFYGGDEGSYDEFYDIRKDPTEMRNLYGERRYRRRIARLQRQLDKFRSELAVDEY